VIPEDRHDSGLVLDMSVSENLALVHPEQFSRRGLIDAASLRARAAELIAEFGIQCEGPDAPMWTLSGGNQQRVVLARELSADPAVLVAAHPTRGLDVGGVEQVMARLRVAAGAGVAVLLITSEIDDLLGTADRVVVMRAGAVVAEVAGPVIDADRISSLLSGANA
jgi:simple sugar transport system ATP-binding protein